MKDNPSTFPSDTEYDDDHPQDTQRNRNITAHPTSDLSTWYPAQYTTPHIGQNNPTHWSLVPHGTQSVSPYAARNVDAVPSYATAYYTGGDHQNWNSDIISDVRHPIEYATPHVQPKFLPWNPSPPISVESTGRPEVSNSECKAGIQSTVPDDTTATSSNPRVDTDPYDFDQLGKQLYEEFGNESAKVILPAPEWATSPVTGLPTRTLPPDTTVVIGTICTYDKERNSYDMHLRNTLRWIAKHRPGLKNTLAHGFTIIDTQTTSDRRRESKSLNKTLDRILDRSLLWSIDHFLAVQERDSESRKLLWDAEDFNQALSEETLEKAATSILKPWIEFKVGNEQLIMKNREPDRLSKRPESSTEFEDNTQTRSNKRVRLRSKG
ncbi:uncharacterized protein IL334_003685 [Kwoniella shivajii]|uniref:BRCT domain-containing protein n=1 Tax=Kwoniella shivajii TaxID=564305 RepID=A0ABZ1CZF3_9TREE|nr:hypothetical protein IL334_003685 [Kwoniella shivajii]